MSRELVANLVSSWNPEAILVGGNVCAYGGAPEIAAANAVYDEFVQAGRVYPAIGDQDYNGVSSVDLTAFLNYFKPPGWATPSNLSGNNGRYYQAKIGPHVEVFCLSSGWNTSLAADAVNLEVAQTLEAGGISSGGLQYQWLTKALAKSTAIWKLVFFHFPPYCSSYPAGPAPGFMPMRWPFKAMGASAVFNGHAPAYERLDVDGLPYFVAGWSGADLNARFTGATLGSQIRESDSDRAQYGALKITATANWLRVQALSIALNVTQHRVDDYTLWADPLSKGFTRRQFVKENGFKPSSLGAAQTVLRFNDTEYTSVGAEAVARVPRQEAEVFVLLEDNARYRIFGALPLDPGAKTITYDKVLKRLLWRSQAKYDVALPQDAAPQIDGYRSGQNVEFIGAAPGAKDAETWRQAAAQSLSTPCHERVIENRKLAPDAVYSTQNTGSNPRLFAAAGVFTFENLPTYWLNRAARSQWFQLNLLVEPLIAWQQTATDWSPVDSVGAISAAADGLTLPAPAASNGYQLSSNSPSAAWRLTLPTGIFNVSFDWLDLNVAPVPFNVTVRWNGQTVYAGQWFNSQPVPVTSDGVRLTTSSTAAGTLTLTVNGPQTLRGLKITKISFTRLDTVRAIDYRVNLRFYDTGAQTGLAKIPGQTFKFRGALGSADVISTEWIDASLIDGRDFLNVEVKLLDDPAAVLAIRQVEMRTRIKVTATPDWSSKTGYKSACLHAALNGCRVAYATRIKSAAFRAAGEAWTSQTTEAWLRVLEHDEPRLKLAFRPSSPGDLGRPALVPDGVYPVGATIAAPELDADCAPTLVPWQAWMAELGFLVASEEFWTVLEPAKPAKLVIIDPTDEDSVKYDALAPSLDFTQAISSQYLPLAL